MRPALIVLILATAQLPQAAGQVMRGEIREETSQAVVRGVFVSLLDETGQRRAGALTDSAGRYALRAPGAGVYRLRAERIGYQSVTGEPIDLNGEETRTVSLALAVAALKLPDISVRGNQRCVANPQNAAETARVWDEIRKALTVAVWLQGEGNARFRVRSFQQELSRALEPEGPEQMTFDLTEGRQAFHTTDADSLARFGYVQKSGNELVFNGPDAELLISADFLARHCFRLERNRAHPRELGLAFTPMRGRLSDIEGALWIDEATGALRTLEYRFTRMGFSIDPRYAHGRTEFEQLPNGAWIVRRWVMTLPKLEATSRTRVSVAGARVNGAEVLDATLAENEVVVLVPSFQLAGFVYDSLRASPLAGARVTLPGTALETRTDAQGRFLLDSVPRGEYHVTVQHARLDSIPAPAPSARVRVDSALTPLVLATAAAATMRANLCTDDAYRAMASRHRVTVNQLGAVRVNVVDEATGAPLGDVRVRLVWHFEESNVWSTAAGKVSLQSSTNENGQVTLCGVAGQDPFHLEAHVGRQITRAGPFRLPAERVMRLVLRIPAA